jgi:hypothetical protein
MKNSVMSFYFGFHRDILLNYKVKNIEIRYHKIESCSKKRYI